MMRVLLITAFLLACADAASLNGIVDRLIPSFATGYIIKGQDATPHEAPYIVSLSRKASSHSHICGGTIISPQWVLTAAHCISNPVGMSIVAGLHERTNFNARTQQRIVDYGKVHEGFSGGVGPNDIAILHVSQPFTFNAWVQPALLPAAEEIPDGETHLYGWGQPKAFNIFPARTLQTVQTQIVEWNRCKAALPESAPLAESNVCSDSLQSGISACNGDSGGPLVKQSNEGTSELVGIVSWGYIPCGLANMPSVYTRVSAFIDWVVDAQRIHRALN